MTFSDALPVQFWLADCETFNEKQVDGIFSKCFCQIFNCTDEITTQFKDITGYTRRLAIYNEDGENLYNTAFTEVSSGVYQLAFTPLSAGICDEDIQLKVFSQGGEVTFPAPSLWTDVGSAWTSKSATFFGLNVTTATGSRISYHNASIPSGAYVVFKYTITISGSFVSSGPGGIGVRFYFENGGTEVSTSETENTIAEFRYFSAPGTYEVTELLSITSDATEIRIRLDENILSGSPVVTITPPVGKILYLSDTSVIAKSDCISIKEDHEESILINYHNNRQFASLNSSVGTPDPEFNLRIPAIFFDERHPRETEHIKLSNSRSVQLSAEIMRQKQLKIKSMPYYMHLKTQLALAFQNVTIDSEEWIMKEAYELDPGNPKHPLKKANVWLDEKDYIMRNVL
jgi:hypothetical protein